MALLTCNESCLHKLFFTVSAGRGFYPPPRSVFVFAPQIGIYDGDF